MAAYILFFLEIIFVQMLVCLFVCVCVCVCVPKAINNYSCLNNWLSKLKYFSVSICTTCCRPFSRMWP